MGQLSSVKKATSTFLSFAAVLRCLDDAKCHLRHLHRYGVETLRDPLIKEKKAVPKWDSLFTVQ